MTGIVTIFNRHIMEAVEEQEKKRYPYHKKYIRAAARMAPVGAVVGAGHALKFPSERAAEAYKETLKFQYFNGKPPNKKEALNTAKRIFMRYRPSGKVIGKKALAGAAIGAGIGVGAKALEKHRDKVTVAKAALEAKRRLEGYM